VTRVDPDTLETQLKAEFDAGDRPAHVVARQARDLADAGQIESDLDHELTADRIVANLRDAPSEYSLVERWNWWLGALELSHGGYERFRIRPDAV